MAAVADQVERNFLLLVATEIEDKLQDFVPEKPNSIIDQEKNSQI